MFACCNFTQRAVSYGTQPDRCIWNATSLKASTYLVPWCDHAGSTEPSIRRDFTKIRFHFTTKLLNHGLYMYTFTWVGKSGCQVIEDMSKKIGKKDIATPKNRAKIGFSSKKIIFSYIYILNRVSSSEKGQKMDSSMIWTKSILMLSEARQNNIKEWSCVK